MPKIIFAIDENGPQSFRTRARFLRHLDTLRAMGKLRDDPRTAIGHWVDPDTQVSWLEPSYVLDAEDFHEHVQPHGWVNGQKCVLSVDATSCAIVGLANRPGEVYPLGAFRCIGKVMPQGNWTRFDDTGEFWVAGNE